LELSGSASVVVAPEAANLADRESRVRSEESRTGTTAVPAADENPQLDYSGSLANAAEVIAAPVRGGERAAYQDCGVSRPIRLPHGLECLA
jgi:hypothetical protein